MNTRAFIYARSGSRDGVALILVLAFIVILTVLVVSFIAYNRLNGQSTASYSKSIQAQEVAQGGLEDIINDLQTEIVAGSSTQNAGNANYSAVYVPNTNWTAQPAHLGFGPSYATLYGTDVSSTNASGVMLLPPTILRVSKGSQDGTTTDFYPPLSATYYTGTLPPNRASNASCTNSSIDGRTVTAARWNSIDLLTTNTTIPSPFLTNAPDWVYVTRAGSRACTNTDLASMLPASLSSAPTSTANASEVIGRYAYVVYDEGALLDVNSVGYTHFATNSFTSMTLPPANSYTTNGVTQVITSKSYSSYADLTQIPGFNSTGAQTNIDNLIAWRNASANMTGTGAGTNYYQAVYNAATSGFLSFKTSATGTDSPLLSRQDLINYFAKLDPAGTSYSHAVPYLGTFSRANNAPSWTPPANSSSLYGYYGLSSPNYAFVTTYPNGATGFRMVPYKDNAENSVDGSVDANGQNTHNANRDVPNVRYTTTQTIKHWNDDGQTSYTYTVKAGDPVVQHRFSLAKLAWLTSNGPAAGISAQAIQDCFGLVWDPQNLATAVVHYDRWDYVAATSADVHILTLDEIAGGCSATANPGYREPNFFEMLKAGILSGSIGQSPGPLTGANGSEGPPGKDYDTTSTEKNRHILQIGANVIDQFDTDSIPTTIYLALFPGFVNTTESDLAFNTVYGDENLVELDRVGEQVMEDWFDPTGVTGYQTLKKGTWKEWLIPEVWNIHQTPPTGVDMSASGQIGYPHPVQYRLHAYGKLQCYNRPNGSGFNTNWPSGGQTANPIDYDDTSTQYPYTNASSATPPTGTPSNITGGQDPSLTSGVAVTWPQPNTPPAGHIYFTDGGLIGANMAFTAASPFYRFPDFLQTLNLYAAGGYKTTPPSYQFSFGFRGTSLLNVATTPYDSNAFGDFPSTTWSGIHFVGFFAGEDPSFWSVDWITAPPSSTNTAFTGFIQFGISNISNPLYFSAECQDPTTLKWHPYNFISRLMQPLGDNTSSAGVNYYGMPGSTGTAGVPGTASPPLNCAANGQTYMGGRGGIYLRPDPRTDRFSMCVTRVAQGQSGNINTTLNPQPNLAYHAEDYWPWRTWGFVYKPNPPAVPSGDGSDGQTVTGLNGSPQNGAGAFISDWQYNIASTSVAFYADPDGVVRPGDAYRGNTNLGDGMLEYHGCLSGNPSSSNTGTIASALVPTTQSTAGSNIPIGSGQARRPMILNRPFRNVGELGYAFRDLPFKTIDLSSSASGDTALLDLFSIADEPSLSAGEINLSNTPASVMVALMTSNNKMESNAQYTGKYDNVSAYPTGVSATTGAPNFMTTAEASAVARGLASSLVTNGPLANRADLVSRLDPIVGNPISGYSSTSLLGLGYLDYGNKAYAEAPVRALSNVASSRTWNLLIDIIAQSGQMSPAATTLNDFIVQGERRYWLHVAIDRYTGKILDQQLEPVYE